MPHRRQARFERAVERAVRRFANQNAVFECANGVLSIDCYRSRPMYSEENDIGRRAIAAYDWIVTKSTFFQMSTLAGFDGLFDSSCVIKYDGDIYKLDKTIPFESLGLGSGYRLHTTKIKDNY